MKKIKITVFLAGIILLYSCSEKPEITPAKKDRNLVDYVNPFIGTGGHGHTFPGATMPFGMMQLSPDTRLDGWDGCSGYHYSDSYIYGFSHTHLSGTGVSDYGDVLLMPTNTVEFNNGANGQKGYRAHFSHDNEMASPGYYKVQLDSTNINVELTVSERSGMHRYTFPENSKQIIILDLKHRDEVLSSAINIVSNTEISGHRNSKAWATDQRLFYNIRFSKPFTEVRFLDNKKEGKNVKAAFTFDDNSGDTLEVKVGISAVDEQGAKNNLEAEIGNKSFDEIKKAASETWEKQLDKLIVEGNDTDTKTIFYTALYHTMIAPNLYQDVDGRYRGMDLNIHRDSTFNYYTVFSLWDTYRAANPLYTIIEPDRTADFINTFLSKYKEGGIMPIWDLSGCYTGCMIGYHGVPVIADAYQKGIRGFNADMALEAMVHSAMQDHLGLASYKKYGFIPVEEESESVSKTLEYAYDDWTIAQMAKALGKTETYAKFIQRAQNYKNVFDPGSKFMRGRFKNTWFAPFDPYEVNFNYTEANAWQYSFYVPQDISGFTELMGGKATLENQLDSLFTAHHETSGRDQADITGLIGQYAHGNEPSHHIAYLYNFVNKPAKTAQRVHEILTTLYRNAPDGISGNEDCGQMSAWYVLSALGFYPVTPASGSYIIGTPLFKKATINLENGKQFTIVADNLSDSNFYIQSATLNGKKYPYSYIKHSDIIAGGDLDLKMGASPSAWGTADRDIPQTSITDDLIVPDPFIEKGNISFKDSTTVVLGDIDTRATIYYALNDADYTVYEHPLKLGKSAILKIYASRDGKKSPVITTAFNKIDPDMSITLKTAYENQYNGGGNDALIDGIKGSYDFRTGLWQGYQNKDVEAIVNLGHPKKVNKVSVNFLEDQRSWIFLPTEVQCYTSSDGNHFKLIGTQNPDSEKPSDQVSVKTITFDVDADTHYIKIDAKKLGDLPEWHLGHLMDGKSWIFVDEITIE